MSKEEFLAQLHRGLSGLPREDIEERLAFYSEMIDDRMEEGGTVEDAVSGIGSVEAIIAQIKADIPLTKLVRDKITPKKSIKAWEIVLLVLGAPVWLSLAVAAFAVIVSLYAAFWAVIISLWAVCASLIGCAFGGIAAGIGFAFGGHNLTGIALIGAGIVCAGLSIFAYFGCKAATTGTVRLTKKIVLCMKNCFMKKEEAE